MNERGFRAMNTDWWLTAEDPAKLDEAERLVHDAETRLSRFRPTSAISALNRDRSVIDGALADVLRRALGVRDATGGAFDPAVGAAVIAAGYDRSFEAIGRVEPRVDPARPRVHLDGDRIDLEGAGLVDVGGIAKGWTVDRVAEVIARGLVDGGGDLRAVGPEAFLVGVPGARAVRLRDAAVATSSTARRRWPGGHHVVRPATSRPSARVTTAVVLAADSATSDALATALVADLERALPALRELGAGALIEEDGWWMTPGMEEHLR